MRNPAAHERLLLIGTSHRVAGAAHRARLACTADEMRALLVRARACPALAEVVYLGTCHRTEWYVVTSDPAEAERTVRELIVAFKGADLLGPDMPRYVLEDEGAAHHLCRVACGLDSLVIGEVEIMGQVRRAVAAAREARTIGPLLDAIARAALRAGRRSRTETRIAAGAHSVASAGVALAERTLGSLAGRRALVIGAGQAGRQALARLSTRRLGRLIVASRSRAHAADAGARWGADVTTLDAVPSILVDVDVVVAATIAPAPVIRRADVASARRTAGHDAPPLVLVDLSMPPVIDLDVAAESGVTLHALDDVRFVVLATAMRRREALPQVEAIAREEARAGDALRQRAVA